MKTFIKIIFGMFILASLILNIINLNLNLQIKDDLKDLYWDINTIDNNIDNIQDDVSEIKDDVFIIKKNVDDIEYYLY